MRLWLACLVLGPLFGAVLFGLPLDIMSWANTGHYPSHSMVVIAAIAIAAFGGPVIVMALFVLTIIFLFRKQRLPTPWVVLVTMLVTVTFYGLAALATPEPDPNALSDFRPTPALAAIAMLLAGIFSFVIYQLTARWIFRPLAAKN